MGSGKRGLLASWIRFGRSTGHGSAVVATGIVTERGPDTVRGPDVSYWSAARLPFDLIPVGYPEIAPDLCVEVLSPATDSHRSCRSCASTSNAACAWCGWSIQKTGRWLCMLAG